MGGKGTGVAELQARHHGRQSAAEHAGRTPAWRQQRREYFRHARLVMGGALTRSLAVAADSAKAAGTAETLNSAKSFGGGAGRGEGEDLDWAEEVTNEVAMQGVAGSERPATPTPTPARWTSATPVPVTPTKGNKRMAMGTPRPIRRSLRPAVRLMPASFAAASALEQILAAIAGVERKMEEKVAALEPRKREGMGALDADENVREERVAARLLADAEEREKRLAMKLLAVDAIEAELAQKAQWELKQWEDLARDLEARRRDIREVRQAVNSLVSKMAREGREHQGGQGTAGTASAVVPQAGPSTQRRAGQTAAGVPQRMDGVVATPAPGYEAVQGDAPWRGQLRQLQKKRRSEGMCSGRVRQGSR